MNCGVHYKYLAQNFITKLGLILQFLLKCLESSYRVQSIIEVNALKKNSIANQVFDRIQKEF